MTRNDQRASKLMRGDRFKAAWVTLTIELTEVAKRDHVYLSVSIILVRVSCRYNLTKLWPRGMFAGILFYAV